MTPPVPCQTVAIIDVDGTRTGTMLHLLFLEYIDGEDAAAPHIAGHVAYLERHHSAGTFLLSGQTVPSSVGGVIIAHGVDRAEAERITTEDPFIQSGVARYRIITVDPGRTHPALAALINAGHRPQ